MTAPRLARLLVLVATLLAFATVGCQDKNKQPEPNSVPASESVNYATSYPGEVQTLQLKYSDQKLAAEEAIGEFGTYPEKLKDPDWRTVHRITEQADADGRNEAFGDAVRNTEIIEDFVAQYGDDVSKYVGRNVDRTLEKETGESEFRSKRAARTGLNTGVKEYKKDHLLKASDAMQAIEYDRDAIGKKNVEPLQEQVLAITLSSYVVNIQLVELRNELENELANSKDVKETLESNLKALDDIEAQGDLSKSQKEYNSNRRTSIQEALGRIDQDVADGEAVLKKADDDANRAQDTYQEAIDSLLDELDRRASEQEAEAGDAG